MSTAQVPRWFLEEWTACCIKVRGGGPMRLEAARRPHEPRDPWTLVALADGGVRIATSGRSREVAAPAQILIPPGRRGQLQIPPGGLAGFGALFLVLPAPGMRNPLARLPAPAVVPGPLPLAQWQAFAAHFRVDHAPRDPFAAVLARPILDDILLRLLLAGFAHGSFSEGCPTGKTPEWLDDLAQWMYANALRAPTLAEILRQAGVSSSHLLAQFRRHYGESPMAFLRRQRMHQATRLLAERIDQPIAEIAARCGYRNLTLFARHFRRAHGASPREWRRRLRGDAAPRAEIRLGG